MADTVLRAPDSAAVRRELTAMVTADLLGPAGGDYEEVEERVSERYIVGALAPQRSVVRPEELDGLANDGPASSEEGTPEPDAPPLPSLFPSSMGLSFCVDLTASELVVRASWGCYQRTHSQAANDPATTGLVWRRSPAGGQIHLPLQPGDVPLLVPDAEQPEVVVRGRVRRGDGEWLVSLFLVNGQPEPSQLVDTAWLFQCELAVSGTDGAAVFRRRPSPSVPAGSTDAAESRRLAMLYRTTPEFAVGHGVGVHAELAGTDPTYAVELRTATMPLCEVARTDAPNPAEIPELAGLVLDMAELADTPDDALPAALEPLAAGYESWIQTQAARVGDPAQRLAGYETEAAQALADCRRAAVRIRAGIAVLAADPLAAQAFRFANAAMRQQRVHVLAAEARRRDPTLPLDVAVAQLDVAANRSWRPFQLAFVLLTIPALTDPRHPERTDRDGLVDLLWFPTGGGKTEAYLGLTAYAMVIRRLQGDLAGLGPDGVTVLMRYTLRLLTVQQFQRAATLLCACEAIRREAGEAGDRRWGETPFRVGLWVGGRVTPNRTEGAEEWVRQQRSSKGWQRGASGGSPHQLTSCPWCGTPIAAQRDVTVDMTRRRTTLACGDPSGSCPFTLRSSPGEGLPVVVVDEEVYRLLPALVIATVDKFAQLPWRGEVQMLFGRVTGRCSRHGYRSPDLESCDWEADRHPAKGGQPAASTEPTGWLRPPDLIVQDELHLIAGPLGSLVGLYETAVDRLCSRQLEGRLVRPKVIASTATVRRAAQQVHALFLRNVDVFPPPGLDASDSFFARQRPAETASGRQYLGVCAHGRRFKAVLIRVYVAAMLAAQHLHEKYGRSEVTDPYMSLVGYFSSLRELGGMRRLVDDDVATRLGKGRQRGLTPRRRPVVEELTSRLSSGQIPVVLERLSTGFHGARVKGSAPPIDVLLATNMVSVGVDVPRLGLMVVAGQPKGTSEYIQATSRIGRAAPGLVIAVYNWARPRDLSHYETFEHYHSTFYRQVEALSVTPFADRALDRGLTALLVALVRQTDTPWDANAAAERVDRHADLPKAVVYDVQRRAERVAAGGVEVGQRVATTLEARLDQWAAEQQRGGRRLGYQGRSDGETVGLLHEPAIRAWDEWTCLRSLRDVEPSIRLLLTHGDLGESAAPGFEPGAGAEGAGGPV